MVERLKEIGLQTREPQPAEPHYDYLVKWLNERRQHCLEGKVVIKGKDCPFQQTKQSYAQYFSSIRMWDKLGATGWHVFKQRIIQHSGRHRHQGGLAIFILEGKGYSVVDGIRYDWKAGDLIVLPLKPGGVEHQHFNLEDKYSEWLAFIYLPWWDMSGGELVQTAVHPMWQKSA